MNINRDYREADTRRPLLHRFPRQFKPATAHIELLRSGDVSVDWCGEIGNTPVGVYRGLDRRYNVPADLTIDEIDSLLVQAEPLLERIHAGSETAWDGRNNVGRLTADAQAAADELDRLCESVATATEWDEDIDGPSSRFWPAVAY